MRFSWASGTDPGRVRDHNEDAVWPEGTAAAAQGPLVIAVADGMGGHIGGEIASATALRAAVEAPDAAAEERVQIANLAVIDQIVEQPNLAGMGTTLTLAVIEASGALSLAHIGDSRAYLLHEGNLERLTHDHSLVAELLEAGEITPERAAVHPFRSVITRALGLERRVQVDTLARDLDAGDRVLLCSDGLTNMVDDGEVADIVGGADRPEDAVWALIEAANRAGGIDNITAIVAFAEPEPSDPD